MLESRNGSGGLLLRFECRRRRLAVCRGDLGRAVATAALVGLWLGGAAAVGAQISPNGGELQVNAYTTSYQMFAAVTADAVGNFVVVWQSYGSSGTDTGDASVQAQRFDAGGAPVGPQIQVNTYVTSSQSAMTVAVGPSGGFVVAWQSHGSSGTDTSASSVNARRYQSDGTPVGGEFQVNSYTTNSQRYPAVAVDSGGGFVVVWESLGSSGTDASGSSIQLQRFDAQGAPLAGESQVNTYVTSFQRDPAVTLDGEGNFVVAWESYGSSGTDTDSWSIQARRYAAGGLPLGSQFEVNSYTSGDQRHPALAVDGGGNFVVAWQSYGSNGGDTELRSIQARRYDAAGLPVGEQFQVNSYTTDDQQVPALAVHGAGAFVVAWDSRGSSGTDTHLRSVQAQRFDAEGDPLGGQFQVNTYTTGFQYFPAVAGDGRGNFVVAWHSPGSSGTDTDGTSIQAQRYDNLFRDGFASGDTSRWSLAAP